MDSLANESASTEPASIEDMVTIHAPEIDVDEIMATIRRNMQTREGTNGAISTLEFKDITCPEEAMDGEYAPLLHFLLQEMNKTYILKPPTAPELTPSPLDKAPLIGSIWNILRRHLHSLSIYYTNKMGRQISTHNRYPVVMLNLMTRLNQKRDAEIATLKQELAELKEKLADLEQRR